MAPVSHGLVLLLQGAASLGIMIGLIHVIGIYASMLLLIHKRVLGGHTRIKTFSLALLVPIGTFFFLGYPVHRPPSPPPSTADRWPSRGAPTRRLSLPPWPLAWAARFTGFASPLADLALAYGSAEELALMMLAFPTFLGLGGDDIAKTRSGSAWSAI